jgi:hypothetical protein
MRNAGTGFAQPASSEAEVGANALRDYCLHFALNLDPPKGQNALNDLKPTHQGLLFLIIDRTSAVSVTESAACSRLCVEP